MKLIFFGIFDAAAERKVAAALCGQSSFCLKEFLISAEALFLNILERFLKNLSYPGLGIKESCKSPGSVLSKRVSVYNTIDDY